ncbi:MAG TPA: putative quinol monooxygenase [Solirubrobacteraceae bacterium]|nr:putative quinol monooxygenase [Solirubrobacteraceae bacterium]
MAFVVLAKWIARPGEEEAVAAAIDALIPPSRQEPGMLVYQAHRDPQNPRVFLLYEQYVDEDAYRAHGESEHFQRHGHGDALPRLASRQREFYETW